MQCPECKSEVEESKAFCYSCGARLIKSSTDIIPPPPGQATTPPPQKRNDTIPHNKKGKSIAILSGVILAALLSVSIAWAIKGELPLLGEFPFSDQVDGLLESLSLKKQKSISAYAPQDTYVYIEGALTGDNEQFSKAVALWDKFPGTTDIEEALLTELESDSECLVVWDTHITPWLGDKFALFTEAPKDMEQETLSFTIALAVKDDDALKSFFDFMITDCDTRATTTSYRGTTITIYEQDTTPEFLPDQNSLPELPIDPPDQNLGNVHRFEIDGYLFLAYSKSYAEAIIDVYKDGSGLYGTKAFKNRFSGVSDGKLLSMYYDLGPIADLSWETVGQNPNLFSGGDIGDIEKKYQTLIDACQPIVGYLEAHDDGIWASYNVSLDESSLPEELTSLMTSVPDTAFRPALPSDIPNTTAIYIGMNNPKQTIEHTLSQLDYFIDGFEEQLALFKIGLTQPPVSINIDEDILSWMDGELALVVLPNQRSASIHLVLTVTDPELVDARLQALIRVTNAYAVEALSKPNQKNPPKLITADTLAGQPIYRVTIEDTTEDFNPVFGIVGNNLIVSSSPQGLRQFIEVNQGERISLVGNSTYQALIQKFGQETHGYLYVNSKQLLELSSLISYSLEVPADDSAPEPAIDIDAIWEQIEPFKGFMASISQDKFDTDSNMFVLIQ